ncbi:cell wall metabolism sensor histidine kinase WalK [Frondihabitans sp. VKM Ac-2883]|uniref:sensor histidine kinase n=1 Tax=Frondihabitans sp. VKM Ac-2883 TaxID=2783823 RepID=UPI00188D092B|nr:ATP-binding protein [Frondihabitans sp. VKM Ac-2883]MBF4575798.1 two-component sensor histidine kinase [Frondihabitans sp. VKM Ac-2883]
MSSPWLVPLSLAFGVIVGAGLVLLVVASVQRGRRARALSDASLPDGIGAMLDTLESAGFVVDPSNNVQKASAMAIANGLVQAHQVVHPEIVDLIETARDEDHPVTRQLLLARSLRQETDLRMLVRASRLGTRYVVVLAEDHTETHRLEEVRRDFVANISHELKTPIGAVGLLAEAMESAADDPEQVRHFAKSLMRESLRLGRLTQDIIELSRLQSADPLSGPELVDVRSVINAAVERNRVEAEARGIEIITRGGKHASIVGDSEMLAVAVHNLVANAVHYSPDDSRIGIGANVTDRGIVEIAVTDQGDGIADSEKERIFERFYRIDPARSRRTGGTGLGLAIVKHIVQNHGGDIRLWSQLGSGSTFTILLPEASTATVPVRGENE